MDVIKIIGFEKSYGTKHVHQGVSFTVKKGECLGLIGGSGVGKSVILRSLIGLEKPDLGKIFLFDTDITDFDEKQLIEIRKRMAYVFQGGALFDSMSVFDNLAYPLREHTQMSEEEISTTIKEQLKEFGLEGNEDIFPASLSGGMQKRVGLARAIIMKPEVVLYDEPTAGLDPFNTKKIQDMILRLKLKGVTSIFVTHDMPTAIIVCDRIAILMNGIIKAQGTLNELHGEKDSLIRRFMNGEIV